MTLSARGCFITLEGGDGAGKSTQVRAIVSYLESKGLKAIATREVGGCPSAEHLREVWLSKAEGYWDPLTELLLIMAARREHLVNTVWPALDTGTWVVSDRFVDSTRAYQGVGLGLGLDVVDALYKRIAGNFWPDLTLVLDIPVEQGRARCEDRNAFGDRYEQQKNEFHNTLRTAYLAIAQDEADRIVVLDASGNPSQVTQQIAPYLDRLIMRQRVP